MTRLLFTLWMLSGFAVAATWNGSAGGATHIRSFGSSDLDVALTTTDNPRFISGGSTVTNSAVNARVTTTTTGASYKHDKQINPTVSGTYSMNLGQYSPTWTTSNSGVATVNASGFVTHVSDGAVTIGYNTPFGNWSMPFTLATTSASVTAFKNWSAGYLGADLNSEIDTLLATAGTASPGTLHTLSTGYQINLGGNMGMFTAWNDSVSPPVIIRNTSLWTGSLDFSGVSVGDINNRQPTGTLWTPASAATLITNNDAVVATHTQFAWDVGTYFVWVDNANQAYTAYVGSYTTLSNDISIIHLTWQGTAPTTLKHYKIFPANVNNYAPDKNMNDFPVVCLNQFKQAFVHDVYVGPPTSPNASTPFAANEVYHTFANESNRVGYTTDVVKGDSSYPDFAVVNGDLILLCAHTTGYGSCTGGWPSALISSISASLTSGSLGQVDLSNFTFTP